MVVVSPSPLDECATPAARPTSARQTQTLQSVLLITTRRVVLRSRLDVLESGVAGGVAVKAQNVVCTSHRASCGHTESGW